MNAAENRRRLALQRSEPSLRSEGQMAPGMTGAEVIALRKLGRGAALGSSRELGKTDFKGGWKGSKSMRFGKGQGE